MYTNNTFVFLIYWGCYFCVADILLARLFSREFTVAMQKGKRIHIIVCRYDIYDF